MVDVVIVRSWPLLVLHIDGIAGFRCLWFYFNLYYCALVINACDMIMKFRGFGKVLEHIWCVIFGVQGQLDINVGCKMRNVDDISFVIFDVQTEYVRVNSCSAVVPCVRIKSC